MARTSSKKKQEQLEVPGTEREKHEAIEAAATKLREIRVDRMDLQAEAQAALLEEMEKAGVTSYRFHLDDEELVATAESKRKVKIRKTATPTLSIVTD